MAASDNAQHIFLPDLCGVRPLFAVVIICELLVFVLTLTSAGFGTHAIFDLALLSLYVQFLTLSAAAALCLSRRWLGHFSEAWVATLSYALILLVVALVCELAWWVLNPALGTGALIDLSHRDFFWRTLLISAIAAALILRYFYVQFHWQQQVASEARARLQALQARIRPHFFFNCMNTIASLTRSDPARAERAVEDLADLFRASLSEPRGLVTLAEEIDLAERYLQIEALRLGARLTVDWQLADVPTTTPIPQLTLQPLLENAIYHGIEPLPSGGRIELRGEQHDDAIIITLRNPLPAVKPHAGNQLAQDNVRQRLAAHFGARGKLTITTTPSTYEVTIHLPRKSTTST